jgi:two-component system nitrate/nitrite response regulator NarL
MAIVDSQNDVSSEQISILIADDHELILDIARLYLDQQSDMSVSTAMTLNDAIDTYQKAGPFDVVLLDYNMPGMNGLEGLRQMMALAPGIPVAIITGNPTRPLMNDVLEAGAAGIVSKSSPVKSLANSIRFIHSGETYMPLHLTREDPKKQRGDTGPLSSREITVLSYLGEGKKNKQIAVSLGLSEGTVKMHVMSICKKLDATNRTHAVINARNTGLL